MIKEVSGAVAQTTPLAKTAINNTLFTHKNFFFHVTRCVQEVSV